MSINPADSQIFGTLYGTDEIRALFSDHAHLQFMLDVEAALARAESALGLVPAPVADAIRARAELKTCGSITSRIARAASAILWSRWSRNLAESRATKRRAGSILARPPRTSWIPRSYCN